MAYFPRRHAIEEVQSELAPRSSRIFSAAPCSRRRRSWVLSWPVPRVVSDVYMCTTAWPVLTRSQSSFIRPQLGNLNHLCTEPFSTAASPFRCFIVDSPRPRVVVSFSVATGLNSSLCRFQSGQDLSCVHWSQRDHEESHVLNHLSACRTKSFALRDDSSISFSSLPRDKVSRLRHNEEAIVS